MNGLVRFLWIAFIKPSFIYMLPIFHGIIYSFECLCNCYCSCNLEPYICYFVLAGTHSMICLKFRVCVLHVLRKVSTYVQDYSAKTWLLLVWKFGLAPLKKVGICFFLSDNFMQLYIFSWGFGFSFLCTKEKEKIHIRDSSMKSS